MSVKGRFYQVSHAKRQKATGRLPRYTWTPKGPDKQSERRESIQEQASEGED